MRNSTNSCNVLNPALMRTLIVSLSAVLAFTSQIRAQTEQRESREPGAAETASELHELTRVWVDVTGQYRTEARLVEFDGKTVTLQKTNDVVIQVPLEKLSESDRRLLIQWSERESRVSNSAVVASANPANETEAAMTAANSTASPTDSLPRVVRNEAVWELIRSMLATLPLLPEMKPAAEESDAPIFEPDAITVAKDEVRAATPEHEIMSAESNIVVESRKQSKQSASSDISRGPSLADLMKPEPVVSNSESEGASNGSSELKATSDLSDSRDLDAAETLPTTDNSLPLESDIQDSAERANESNLSESPVDGDDPSHAEDIANASGENQAPSSSQTENATNSKAGRLQFEYSQLVRPLPDGAWLQSQPIDMRGPLNVLLRGEDAVEIRRTLRRLAQDPTVAVDDGLFSILAHYVLSDDKFSRLEGIKAMFARAQKRSLPYLLYLLDDSTFEVRWQVYEFLGQVRDDRLIEPLVDHYLTNERNQIEKLLEPYGAQAEPFMFQFLNHPDVEIRSDVVRFLSKIGTQSSIDVLKGLSQEPSATVRLQVRTTIKRIQHRLAKERR